MHPHSGLPRAGRFLGDVPDHLYGRLWSDNGRAPSWHGVRAALTRRRRPPHAAGRCFVVLRRRRLQRARLGCRRARSCAPVLASSFCAARRRAGPPAPLPAACLPAAPCAYSHPRAAPRAARRMLQGDALRLQEVSPARTCAAASRLGTAWALAMLRSRRLRRSQPCRVPFGATATLTRASIQTVRATDNL